MPYKVFLIEQCERVEQTITFICPICHATNETSWDQMVPLDKEDHISDEGFPGYTCMCGRAFDLVQDDYLSRSCGRWWKRIDTGECHRRIQDFPVGAMWRTDWWKSEERKSLDGRQLYGWDWDNQFEAPLVVKTPGGDWTIDSRASNCTRPDDHTHRCWVRHGEAPNIHVDKNGDTCAAGAGSIICGNYHGFLHNGSLTDGF